MPALIELTQDGAAERVDRFAHVLEGEEVPKGPAIVSLSLLKAEGAALLRHCGALGVRLESNEAVEDIVEWLPRLSVVALAFPKFRDGRAYTSARLLRERYGYRGEVRAVGDVLREQMFFMVRCGFDSFEAADGTTAADVARAGRRYRHVYQRGADGRTPAYEERA